MHGRKNIKFITMYQTTGCPNPDRIMNPHHWGHIKSCTKEYKVQLKCRWKYHIVKLKYSISSIILEIHSFSTNCGQFVLQFVSPRNLFEWRRNTGSQITSTGWFQQMLKSRHSYHPCSAITVVLRARNSPQDLVSTVSLNSLRGCESWCTRPQIAVDDLCRAVRDSRRGRLGRLYWLYIVRGL